jgi:BirA family biotin operon repressor/biotin-[acetyl-CoA-carboxylase] ligase
LATTDAPRTDLHPGMLLKMLEANRLCRSIVLFDRIDSTNGAAMRSARSTAAERMLFLTEEQTVGKGRAGRSWMATPGKSLLFSLLVRPPREAGGLTLLLAIAAVRALGESCTGLMIKWPNDIYIGHRKAAGILAESREGMVVLGMGFNVNERASDFPHDLRGTATSLRIGSGRARSRGEILVRILNELEDRYGVWCESGLQPFIEDIERHMLFIGEQVRIESGRESFAGVMKGLTSEGHVCLEGGGGERVFAAGDLSLRGGVE